MYTEIITAYSENNTKPIKTPCRQTAEVLILEQVVYIATAAFQMVNIVLPQHSSTEVTSFTHVLEVCDSNPAKDHLFW